MTYEVAFWNNNRRYVNHVAGSVDEAKAYIESRFANVIVEEDLDNPNHFDVFAYEGAMSEVYSIEPVKES